MYKATRELIKARQPFTQFVVEVVSVRQVGGGLPNKCFQNATNDAMLERGNKVVSGWVVNPYDKQRNSTAIIQHWWNIDAQGVYFDTTPVAVDGLEYVIDTEIADYGQAKIDELGDLVALSLLLQDGSFYAVERVDGKLVHHELPSFETKNLFNFTA